MVGASSREVRPRGVRARDPPSSAAGSPCAALAATRRRSPPARARRKEARARARPSVECASRAAVNESVRRPSFHNAYGSARNRYARAVGTGGSIGSTLSRPTHAGTSRRHSSSALRAAVAPATSSTAESTSTTLAFTTRRRPVRRGAKSCQVVTPPPVAYRRAQTKLLRNEHLNLAVRLGCAPFAARYRSRRGKEI